jgi:hypothetical protein
MNLTFVCTNCGQKIQGPGDRPGVKVRCPFCQAVQTVPFEPLPVVIDPEPPDVAPVLLEPVVFEPAPELSPFTWPPDQFAGASPAPVRPPRRSQPGTGRRSRRIIALIAAGIVLLIVLCVFVLWPLLNRLAGPGDGNVRVALGRELKYLPDKFRDMESLRVDQMVASAVYKELQKASPADVTSMQGRVLSPFPGGIKIEDLVRLTTEDIPPWGGGGGLVIYTMRDKITAEDMIKKLPPDQRFDKVVAGSHTLYVSAGPPQHCFCVPEETIVLVGSPKVVQSVLQRNGPPTLDADIEKALNLADFSKTNVHINGLAQAEVGAHFSHQGPLRSFHPASVLPQEQHDIIIHQTNWDNQISAQAILLTQHPSKLPRWKDEAQAFVVKGMQQPQFPAMSTIMSSVRLTISGNRLIAVGTVPLEHVSVLSDQNLMWF